MASLRGGYKSVRTIITRYWRVYGGLADLVRSPYFHVSLLLSLLTSHTWLFTPWWDVVISVLPNLLGFTLAGFAIFLSFGDERFRTKIAGTLPENSDAPSPLIVVSSTFMHFVLVQISALLWALVAKALHFELPWPTVAEIMVKIGLVGSFVGYWLFLYGICLAAAAGVAIYRLAGWYDTFQTKQRNKEQIRQNRHKRPRRANPPATDTPAPVRDQQGRLTRE